MEEQLTSFLHARAAEDEGQDCLEVIHGGPAVWARIKQVAAVTRSTALSLEPPHRVPVTEQENREAQREDQEAPLLDRALARRGIRNMCVMADQLETHPDAAVYQAWAAAGSPTRYSPSVPLRVLVFDRRIAFFALDARDPRRGAYMTTAPTLVQLACRLFDDVWQRALAIPGLATPARSDGTLDQQRQRVLDLLAQGYTDERIARDMAVSTRTIGRAVAQLQTELGAHSRFQLALLAQQAGLIAHRPTQPPTQPLVISAVADSNRTQPHTSARRGP